MNLLGVMGLIIFCGIIAERHQDTEKGLASLFGSFRVQPCASKSGWMAGLSRLWQLEPYVARDVE